MRKVTTLIVGAGQAGLAMSRELTARSIDHVLVERGEVANSWRTERWDSLRLLTPNWLSGLPDMDTMEMVPDGFMSMSETVAMFDRYAAFISAPVEAKTTVLSVVAADPGYVVHTDRGSWSCQTLVIASGACNIASRPRWADQLPPEVHQLTSMDYRAPGYLDPGKVLIVGASASGVQLAHEIHLSGREVILATGEHVRAPRRYRGHDIMHWMDACGIFDRRIEDADDIRRARRVPSIQLVGGSPPETLDLNSLQAIGVRIAGRAMDCVDGVVRFSGSLANVCALADLKMNRMLAEIDDWIAHSGETEDAEPASRLAPTELPNEPLLSLDLVREGIRTVIWATGYRPDYQWLDLPVLTPRGELRHDRGVVDAPGVFVLGLPFMRTRKSSFIAGAGADAAAIAIQLNHFLDVSSRAAA